MRVFQEESFGPVVATTPVKDHDDALPIANDTMFGLSASVWSRNGNVAYRAGRDTKAGRVWVNNYHANPAHVAFGEYNMCGLGGKAHLMLETYQQNRNLLVSYSKQLQSFF